MTKQLSQLLIPALCALVVSACGEAPPAPADKFIPVRVLSLQKNTHQQGIRYSANITPKTQVQLAFKVNGYIQSIYQTKAANGISGPINPGETISKDTVLARIKDAQYQDKVKEAQASLASAEAAWIKAKADFGRASILYKQNSMTAPDYDSARQEYSTAKANIAGARAQRDDALQNLAYCALKAPIDGVLLQRNIEVGTLINPATIAFVVADMKTVKVVFSVPDTMLKNIRLGEQLAVTTHALPTQIFKGVITTISPSANLQTRVFNIEITLDNRAGLLRDGMVAALKAPRLKHAAMPEILLPINAVVRSKDQPKGYAVYLVQRKADQTIAHLQNIQLGDVHGNNILVEQGLKVSDQVIISGVNIVWDGAPIRIID